MGKPEVESLLVDGAAAAPSREATTDTVATDSSTAGGVRAWVWKPVLGGVFVVGVVAATVLFSGAAPRFRAVKTNTVIGLADDPCRTRVSDEGVVEYVDKSGCEAQTGSHPAAAAGSKCSGRGADCRSTKCCSDPGMRCYEKEEGGRATCKAECVRGPDPADEDSKPWSCSPLGERTPGSPPEEPDDVKLPAWVEGSCSKPGEDCSKSKCCAWSGMQCFVKNEGYSTCRASCTAGPDFADKNPEKWNCTALGGRTPGKGIAVPPVEKLPAWVATDCAKPGSDCSKSMCCAWAGMRCFQKTDKWSACKTSCSPGPDPLDANSEWWTCKALGPRTPGKGLPPPEDLKPAKWVVSKCSKPGEDCSKTRCCVSGGQQCYAKNDNWANCRGSCIPGPHFEDVSPEKWSCKELGSRTPGKVEVETMSKLPGWVATNCSKASTDCSGAMCCQAPGAKCYQKKPGWATCRVTCNAGPDPTDMDSDPWTCKEFGPRTPGKAEIVPLWKMTPAKWVAGTCSKGGEDCSKTRCCAEEGMQCYQKKEGWATCRAGCNAGPDPADADGAWWSCKPLGMRTPGVAKQPDLTSMAVPGWVGVQCAESGDCSKKRCCSGKGMQCFQKNAGWAMCKADCPPDAPDMTDVSPEKWKCSPLGGRTPGAAPPAEHNYEPKAWVKDHCSPTGTDCSKTRCCQDAGFQCYQKNQYYGNCLASCSAEDGWSCGKWGMRTPKPWGKPSLFCFAVLRATGYEPGLIQAQFDLGAGIFACDEFSLLSSDKLSIGGVEAVRFAPAPVGTSKDNTAANTELFMHVWDAIKGDGKYAKLDWTVKVDPDAVLLPDRLRGHLKTYTGQSAYIVNCNKPLMTPMMFGALECISGLGMKAYFAGEAQCRTQLGWQTWGEDFYMGKCLDLLHVQGQADYGIYTDGVCTAVDCSNAGAAAFHPFKGKDAWMGCYKTATR